LYLFLSIPHSAFRILLIHSLRHRSYREFARQDKMESYLAPFHFFSLLFFEKASLRPGSKGVARKKHRREKNPRWRPDRVSAERGGHIGRPTGRPYNGITLFLLKERLARPVQEKKGAS
jgi:hypothetical protein